MKKQGVLLSLILVFQTELIAEIKPSYYFYQTGIELEVGKVSAPNTEFRFVLLSGYFSETTMRRFDSEEHLTLV